MPRNNTQVIQNRKLDNNDPAAVAYQVRANPVDTYVAPKRDNKALMLAASLATVNKNLAPYVDEKLKDAQQSQYEQGRLDRVNGVTDQTDKTETWIKGNMAMSGVLAGSEDGSALEQAYETEFDKDNGNIDQFIAEQHKKMTNGVQDSDFLDQYNKVFLPASMKLKEGHQSYLKKRTVDTMESNAVSMLDKGIRSYVDSGQPVPDGYIDSIRQFLNKDMGVSNSRFNDLMFAAVKRLGDEGNFAVYDMFKRDRPDGTKGMYYIPAWKEQIDQAQIHATSVYLAQRKAAEKEADDNREESQDAALMDVFLEADPKEAARKFDGHVSAGLFTKASDLFAWRKKLEEHVDKSPNVEQQNNETLLMSKLIQRKLTTREIIGSNLTLSQRRYLLGQYESSRASDRSIAAQQVNQGNAVFRSPEYRMGEDYIRGQLRSTASALDPFGVGSTFDQQQQATALLEFSRRAQGVSNPAELNAIREDIVTRYQARRTSMPEHLKSAPGAGRVRYSTPQELKSNIGNMTNDEIKVNLMFLKQTAQTQQPQRATTK